MEQKLIIHSYSNEKKEKREILLNFSRINVPKMKSVFWKYFGFPSNENGSIITKQNVVCVLCKRVLTNHGNTTNLRAHIQSSHKQIFSEICQTHSIKVPLRKPPPKKPKIVLETKQQITNNFKKELFTEYKTSEIDCDEESLAYLDESCIAFDEVIDKKPKKSEGSDTLEVQTLDYPSVAIELDSNHFTKSLATMLIKDLRNVSILYDKGMSEFLTANGIDIPSECKVN